MGGGAGLKGAGDVKMLWGFSFIQLKRKTTWAEMEQKKDEYLSKEKKPGW